MGIRFPLFPTKNQYILEPYSPLRTSTRTSVEAKALRLNMFSCFLHTECARNECWVQGYWPTLRLEPKPKETQPAWCAKPIKSSGLNL